ncbi:MAG: hypothetical protein EXR78_00825 [Deltaproteobacteria bacterium]|nr:hypothetical protein [Deltaproteobacteria bacterium]
MSDTVTISVKLFATLKRYVPAGSQDGFPLSLPRGATVQDAITALHIPPEQAGMLVAGDSYIEKGATLTDGLQLNIFPPLAGGIA